MEYKRRQQEQQMYQKSIEKLEKKEKIRQNLDNLDKEVKEIFTGSGIGVPSSSYLKRSAKDGISNTRNLYPNPLTNQIFSSGLQDNSSEDENIQDFNPPERDVGAYEAFRQGLLKMKKNYSKF
jgi:hypothetical protein